VPSPPGLYDAERIDPSLAPSFLEFVYHDLANRASFLGCFDHLQKAAWPVPIDDCSLPFFAILEPSVGIFF
jgi:hypothetical protein